MITHLIESITGTITTTKKTILKNTVWLTSAEMGSRILRGILSIIAARYLGAEGLGIFSYALALGGFITFFDDVGIGTYVTRSLARNDNNQQTVFATGFIIKTVLGICALLLFIMIGPIVSSIPEAAVLIPAVALLIFFDHMRSFFFTVTRAQERMYIDASIQIGTNILIAGLGLGAILINPSPLMLALGYLIGSLLGTIASVVAAWAYIKNSLASFSYPVFKEIIHAAIPFTIITVSNVLIFNTDSLFLGHYGSSTDVGLYGAASRVIMMFYVISSLFAVATFPNLVQKIKDGAPIGDALKKSLLVLGMVALPLILIMILGRVPIVTLLYGASFIGAAPILAILSLSYLPVFALNVLNNAILAKNIQSKFIGANVAGVLVNIGLDYLLIPHYLGIGAAIASVAGLGTICLVTALILFTTKDTAPEHTGQIA